MLFYVTKARGEKIQSTISIERQITKQSRIADCPLQMHFSSGHFHLFINKFVYIFVLRFLPDMMTTLLYNWGLEQSVETTMPLAVFSASFTRKLLRLLLLTWILDHFLVELAFSSKKSLLRGRANKCSIIINHQRGRCCRYYYLVLGFMFCPQDGVTCNLLQIQQRICL